MAKPMPPIVCGPITPISPFISVTGVLAGADVEVFANGASIGHAIADRNGDFLVPVANHPAVGEQITAVQRTADGASDAITSSTTVIEVPLPLPTPIVCSALNTCMTDVFVDGLVPGATVISSIAGVQFGSVVAPVTAAWLGIDTTRKIPVGTQLQVHQQAVVNGNLTIGSPVVTLRIPTLTLPPDFLPPPQLAPLVQCDTSRSFVQVVPGALTTIVNEGQTETWHNLSETFLGVGGLALRKGAAMATQELSRCGRKGQPILVNVAAAPPAAAPRVTTPLCFGTKRLTAVDLLPGGVLHVYRQVFTSPNVSSLELVGNAGIANSSQEIELPDSFVPDDPRGPVFVALSQERCGAASALTSVPFAPVSGPHPAPKIIEPLFDCCRGIPVEGANPGSLVQAIDPATGAPLSDKIHAAGPRVLITPWFPIAAGQTVIVRQRGCLADGDSPTAKVQGLPQQLPVPKITTPVRPSAAWVRVTGIIPGARLYLIVNGQVRPTSVYAFAEAAVVPVSGAALADKDSVLVVQMLCSKSSSVEGPQVMVTRGQMKITVSPKEIVRGTTAQILVEAFDADTGDPVIGQVLLNGKSKGTTGVRFAYAPGLGDANPAGIVQASPAYADAPFTIALRGAEWELSCSAGPLPVRLDILTFQIDEITWTISPDWDPGSIKTVTVSAPAPPTARGALSLPVPTGAVRSVTVRVSGTASTDGATVNGTVVEAQTVKLVGDTRKVAYNGTNETIGWLLLPKYLRDTNTGKGVVWLECNFAGINP